MYGLFSPSLIPSGVSIMLFAAIDFNCRRLILSSILRLLSAIALSMQLFRVSAFVFS